MPKPKLTVEQLHLMSNAFCDVAIMSNSYMYWTAVHGLVLQEIKTRIDRKLLGFIPATGTTVKLTPAQKEVALTLHKVILHSRKVELSNALSRLLLTNQ